jgi:hypothetical protein
MYFLCVLFNKIGEQEGGTVSARKQRGRREAQTMYTHVSKCKNDKQKIYYSRKIFRFSFIHKSHLCTASI